MIHAIIDYIEFLKKEHGLHVTVHDWDGHFNGFMGQLAPYNIHANPYCLYVKSCREVWDTCIARQYKVVERCKKGFFYGVCYAGVGEYVVPVYYKEELLGFLSISGYKGDRNRIRSTAKTYMLDRKTMEEQFDTYLMDTPPDAAFIKTVVTPLTAMLALLYETSPKPAAPVGDDYLYGHLLSYIHAHFDRDFHLETVAANCHCSVSYACRVFKCKTGTTILQYLKGLRMHEARRLLKQTTLPVGEIAHMTGYNDANYFTNVFKKEMGVSPTGFRRNE